MQDDIEQIMEHFKAFKKNVPVMGSILLDQNMQRVLLVKGWKNSSCWGFPRGKIHKNETDAQCAVREVCLLPRPSCCLMLFVDYRLTVGLTRSLKTCGQKGFFYRHYVRMRTRLWPGSTFHLVWVC